MDWEKPSCYGVSGLAPYEGITAQEQRNHFGRQLSGIGKLPTITFLDWADALDYPSLDVQLGDIILYVIDNQFFKKNF